MMINPDKERFENIKRMAPWLVAGEKEGDPPTLKSEAPKEIVELFNKMFGIVTA